MNRTTLTLVLGASIVYYLVLFLPSGILSPSFNPPPYFLAAPLMLIVLVFLGNLARRATTPTEFPTANTPSRRFSREVQELTHQIEVGMSSGPSYFEKMLVQRIREALVDRVVIETGMDRRSVMEKLSDPRLGPELLKNEHLHKLLYSPPPEDGSSRLKMLEETIALVESWKP